jgi:hypothetical protein
MLFFRKRLTFSQSFKLFLKIFTSAVIKFEGGADFDLQVLDDNYKKGEPAKAENQNTDGTQGTDSAAAQQDTSAEKTVTPVSPSSVPLPETPAPVQADTKQGEADKPQDNPDPSSEKTKSNEDEQQKDGEEKSGDGKVYSLLRPLCIS